MSVQGEVISDMATHLTFLFSTPFIESGDAFLTTIQKLYFKKTFYFRDTMGLPLSFIFDQLQKLADERGIPVSPCMMQFRSDALAAGWNDRKIIADIREALGEAFGTAIADLWIHDLGKIVFQPTGGAL